MSEVIRFQNWLFIGPKNETLVIAAEHTVTAKETLDFAGRRLGITGDIRLSMVTKTDVGARPDVAIRFVGNDANPKGVHGPRRMQVRAMRLVDGPTEWMDV